MDNSIDTWIDIPTRLNLGQIPDKWRLALIQSSLTMPEDPLAYLQNDKLLVMNQFAMLPANQISFLQEAAEFIRNNDDLSRLTWHCCRMMFHHNTDFGFDPFDPIDANEAYIPDMKPYMGGLGHMFLPIILLYGFQQTLQSYEEKQIPQSIVIKTCADLLVFLNDHKRTYGAWGLSNPFFFFHMSFRLFRLGRLQFCQNRYRGNARVFRNIETSETLSLAEEGLHFRRDGLIEGTNGLFDNEQSWISKLEIDENFIRGYPISADGGVISSIATFQTKEWEVVLKRGDPVLDIHIPSGGKMDHVKCEEAIQEAKDFFAKYLPEYDYRAFVCTSWLLYPNYRHILEPSSNIVRFQQRFHLYPVLGSGDGAARGIFGMNIDDLTKVPQDNSLRRAVKRHLESGNSLCDFGGYILPNRSPH